MMDALASAPASSTSSRLDERMEAALRLARECWWEVDADGRFLELAGSTGGLRREALLGRTCAQVPELSGAGSQLQVLREAFAVRQAFSDVEICFAGADGAQRTKLLSGEPVFAADGSFRGYRGIARDVTAHKEAQHALNASEIQLAAVIDAAMDAVLTVDGDGRVVVFNKSAGRMFGCTRAEALGAPLERFVPGIGGLLRELAAPQQGAPRVLARALQLTAVRHGDPFPAEASVSRIDLQGRALSCFVLRDVSERAAAEQARLALETQLRQSQKMEALGIVAGGIAHDFNNIVAAILGNAALARDHLEQPRACAVFVSEIRKAGLRAREMVQRILSFSRKQPAVFTCQPLQPLLEEGAQLLRAMLPPGIEVTLQAPEAPLHVRADGAQVTQVLMNLGTNAWQALGSKPGRIAIRLHAQEGEARIAVADNGCGIDEAALSHIFEPFFTTKPKGEGTGLGLPVVQGIVHDHGGRIRVRSSRGVGTTFEIALPLVEAPLVALATEPVAPEPPERRGSGQHVVYLDDYPAMVFMVSATLQARNYRVTGFEDAAEARSWLREHAHEVDLVVTDYNMPGLSGLDMAAEVAQLRPELPVIVASGNITDELSAGAARAGVRHLFEKPRGIEELCDLVACILTPVEGH